MIPELITRPQADALLWVVLILGCIAGPAAARIAQRNGGDGLVYGLLWGGPPVLAFVMWRVYNAITDRLGLDSVRNLLVNFGMFVVLGAVCGWGWAQIAARRRNTPKNDGDEPAA